MAEETQHEYTREELIAICEQAIVQQDDWCDRDSQSAQVGVGKCWALLKAGCEFQVTYDHNKRLFSACVTDDKTIWLRTWSKGFNYFEYGEDDGGPFENMEEDHFYLPTPKRLAERAGRDWY